MYGILWALLNPINCARRLLMIGPTEIETAAVVNCKSVFRSFVEGSDISDDAIETSQSCYGFYFQHMALTTA